MLELSKRRPPSAFALRASAGQAPSPAVALAKAGPATRFARGGRGAESQSCFKSASAPEMSALPGASSTLSDFTTPLSTSME